MLTPWMVDTARTSVQAARKSLEHLGDVAGWGRIAILSKIAELEQEREKRARVRRTAEAA